MTNKQDISPEKPAENILVEAQRQYEILSKGAVQVIPEGGLMQKLVKSLQGGKPLRIKLGADPTRPDLHLGHVIVLDKLREFQELGHHIQFLIGDFTASIGDPSGRDKTRPPLSQEDISKNVQTYSQQVFQVLDQEKTEIVYNSDWCNKLSFPQILKLLSQVTVSQLLQREDFSNRYKNNVAIFMHEMMYPIMQGYDSVVMQTDVEVCGTDQTFNCLMGREMQKSAEQAQQIVITFPLLEGTDGVKKMSKSLDNYIGITDAPNDMFGKIMSIPDEIMPKYFEYLTDIDVATLPEHPMDAKKLLGETIVSRFHDSDAAKTARSDFETRFSKQEIPDELPEYNIDLKGEATIGLITLLVKVGFAGSNGEARRLIEQNAVKIDGKLENNPKEIINSNQKNFVLQVGKRRMARVGLAV